GYYGADYLYKRRVKMPKPKPKTNPTTFSRGEHPASQRNLTYHKGRPSVRDAWGEDAVKLTTTCTPTAKTGLPDALDAAGYASLAELLEYIGRGLITLPDKPQRPDL
ncbi:MAG: hypothetical protein WCD18_27660, partial [Thermosynechococcaceae cyanobacterium]